MKAEEIRAECLNAVERLRASNPTVEPDVFLKTIKVSLLGEIAAQLAELNELKRSKSERTLRIAILRARAEEANYVRSDIEARMRVTELNRQISELEHATN